MHIQPGKPVAFSNIGQRSMNQDALYPPDSEADEQTQLLIVCDGIGGADKGEIASQLLCDGIAQYASAMGDPIFDQVHLRAALAGVYADYRTYLREHPLVNRMGSTLTLVQFHQQGVTVAHIGDSRVYQVRDGRILFRTNDHKQVNDMVEAGIITAEQARTHPWRNRLSRAVIAGANADDQKSAYAEPDLTILTDVKAGDYFFLCTDGVLEQIDDDVLTQLLIGNESDQEKVQSLLALCDGQTRDNYSGYLVGVQAVNQTDSFESDLPIRSVWY